jgi:hypothetical protein
VTTPIALVRALELSPSCPDCVAAIGKKHDDGCDVARCLWDGGQRFSCDYALDYTDEPESDPMVIDPSDPHDCGEDVWTGMWPGYREAIEFGWWIKWIDAAPGERYGEWRPTTASDPKARPDLNRLNIDCVWDRDNERWMMRA